MMSILMNNTIKMSQITQLYVARNLFSKSIKLLIIIVCLMLSHYLKITNVRLYRKRWPYSNHLSREIHHCHKVFGLIVLLLCTNL